MSLYDKPDYPGDIKEVFAVGEPFVIVAAEYKGRGLAENYPDSACAVLTVHKVGEGENPENAQEVSVWGNLAEAVNKLEEDELPLTAQIGQAGRAYIFEPADPAAVDQKEKAASAQTDDAPPFTGND